MATGAEPHRSLATRTVAPSVVTVTRAGWSGSATTRVLVASTVGLPLAATLRSSTVRAVASYSTCSCS